MVRGVLFSSQLLLDEVNARDLWRVYREAYGSECFVALLNDRKALYKLPDPKITVGTNMCLVGFQIGSDNVVVVSAALDNLVKGAAGNAIQCLNLMFSLDEGLGLTSPGLYPV